MSYPEDAGVIRVEESVERERAIWAGLWTNSLMKYESINEFDHPSNLWQSIFDRILPSDVRLWEDIAWEASCIGSS